MFEIFKKQLVECHCSLRRVFICKLIPVDIRFFSRFHDVSPNFLSTQESEDYPPGLEEALSNAYSGHFRGKRTVKE